VNPKIDVFRAINRGFRGLTKGEAKKNVAVSNLIIRIFMYSAIKINAKEPLLYSVLNPDTSSDSPSARSNGVRLVSAKVVVNQMYNNGRSIGAIHICSEENFRRLKDRASKIGDRRIKDIEIS